MKKFRYHKDNMSDRYQHRIDIYILHILASITASGITSNETTAEDCRLGIPFIHLLSEYKGNPSSKQMVHSDLGWPAELT